MYTFKITSRNKTKYMYMSKKEILEYLNFKALEAKDIYMEIRKRNKKKFAWVNDSYPNNKKLEKVFYFLNN